MTKPSTKSHHPKRGLTGATPTEPKKPVYISIKVAQEKEKLLMLGFRERWAYLELKGISDFKTGVCGEFKDQCLSYKQIAAMVTAPGTQGRGQGGIDDTQAADFLKRMEAVGLVANIGRRANGGLRFDLPLSPINRDKASPSGEISTDPSGKIEGIFPDGEASQMPENPVLARVCDDFAPSPSVMINKVKNISNDEAGSATAESASSCRATGATPALENPPRQPSAAAPLTARQIHAAIAGNWAFSETETPNALTLYASWADAGISLDDLHAAMTSLEEDANAPDLTPLNLAPKLWPKVVDGWAGQLTA